MKHDPYDIVTILGATATGKTALAVRVASRVGGEIISADSRQLYRGMDIGTGKDLAEYVVDGRRVPVHLVDVVEAGYRYNLFEYRRDFIAAWHDCRSRRVLPVLCGGSGLYLDAVLRGYRMSPVPRDEALRERLSTKTLPELARLLAEYAPLHNTTDIGTVERATRALEIAEHYRQSPPSGDDLPRPRSLTVGILFDRERRRQRITERLHARLREGMLDEARALLARGLSVDDLAYYGLEYGHLARHLAGETTYDEMVSSLNSAIHRFAKRQMTWFRKMERDGLEINWLDGDMPLDDKVARVLSLLENP
jgi:tRNA dimethylallyltransferase